MSYVLEDDLIGLGIFLIDIEEEDYICEDCQESICNTNH